MNPIGDDLKSCSKNFGMVSLIGPITSLIFGSKAFYSFSKSIGKSPSAYRSG